MSCVPWVILSDHHHGVDAYLMRHLVMTSFNYGGKKPRDVGLTCRCHLSNFMPDSIFYVSMGWGMTQLLLLLFFYFFIFFFLRGGIAVFLSIEEMDSVLSPWHQWAWETLSYNGLRQMGSIILQWGFSSGARLRITEFIEEFFCSNIFSCFIPGMLRFWSIEPTW